MRGQPVVGGMEGLVAELEDDMVESVVVVEEVLEMFSWRIQRWPWEKLGESPDVSPHDLRRVECSG